MTDKNWAVFALKDIMNALDEDRYEAAFCHINDAIETILACDGQDIELNENLLITHNDTLSHLM